jgi:hypothetical protein
MKTLKKVEVTPVYIEFIPDVLEEGKIYISKEYGVTVHNCLCGCTGKTIMPISRPDDWKLIEHEDGKISFIPSVGNFQLPCKSHYIITKNVANFV